MKSEESEGNKKNKETMKKTYIAPACDIVKLNEADIIATSIGTNDEPGNGVQLSRDGDFWDGDEW